MYNEVKKNLDKQDAGFPRKKAPNWGKRSKLSWKKNKLAARQSSIPWLAGRTGINDKHLFNIVAHRIQDPSSDKRVKIAEALGISFGELATRALGSWGRSVRFRAPRRRDSASARR